MCYGSRCDFEGYMGECIIRDYDLIKTKYGHSSCTIGGLITCVEDEEYYIENKTQFSNFVKEILNTK